MYIRWNYIESDGRLSESNCRLSGSDGRSGKNNGRLGESVMVVWWILGENNSTLGESNGRSCGSDGTLRESDCGYGESRWRSMKTTVWETSMWCVCNTRKSLTQHATHQHFSTWVLLLIVLKNDPLKTKNTGSHKTGKNASITNTTSTSHVTSLITIHTWINPWPYNTWKINWMDDKQHFKCLNPQSPYGDNCATTWPLHHATADSKAKGTVQFGSNLHREGSLGQTCTMKVVWVKPAPWKQFGSNLHHEGSLSQTCTMKAVWVKPAPCRQFRSNLHRVSEARLMLTELLVAAAVVVEESSLYRGLVWQ